MGEGGEKEAVVGEWWDVATQQLPLHKAASLEGRAVHKHTNRLARMQAIMRAVPTRRSHPAPLPPCPQPHPVSASIAPTR